MDEGTRNSCLHCVICVIYIYTHTLCKDLTSNARGVGQYYILAGHTFKMVLSSSAKQDFRKKFICLGSWPGYWGVTYFELVLILKRKFIFKSRSASPFPMKSNGLKFYKQLNLKCMKQILNINAKLRIQDIFLPSPVFLL